MGLVAVLALVGTLAALDGCRSQKPQPTASAVSAEVLAAVLASKLDVVEKYLEPHEVKAMGWNEQNVRGVFEAIIEPRLKGVAKEGKTVAEPIPDQGLADSYILLRYPNGATSALRVRANMTDFGPRVSLVSIVLEVWRCSEQARQRMILGGKPMLEATLRAFREDKAKLVSLGLTNFTRVGEAPGAPVRTIDEYEQHLVERIQELSNTPGSGGKKPTESAIAQDRSKATNASK